jgi:large subunit ribosomal protein L22
MAEKNLNNTAHAIGKSIKSSQQKANLVLRTIRGLPVENAVNILQFSRRRISNIVLKILKSAISNAENNHQLDIDKLYVKEATVGKSMVLKRFRPRARGRAGKILKPFSRIKIQLTEKNLEEKVVQTKKEPNQEKVENGTKN